MEMLDFGRKNFKKAMIEQKQTFVAFSIVLYRSLMVKYNTVLQTNSLKIKE